MKIAIFGSCVSRDTCEFIPNSSVTEYVARQSVTSLDRPHRQQDLDLSVLSSEFQKRMVASDLEGSGAKRIASRAEYFDLVLIDLVDERRGYWQFPDGTTVTNSIEAEACGVRELATRTGARLVEFGTDEHYSRWVSGMNSLFASLANASLTERTVFLDIEWAGALEDAKHLHRDLVSRWGRRLRRVRRGLREATRSLNSGAGARESWTRLRNVKATDAEQFADRAEAANKLYARYRKVVRSLAARAVTRSGHELRIGKDHRWGPEPFHFRDQDYVSIVKDLMVQLGESEG